MIHMRVEANGYKIGSLGTILGKTGEPLTQREGTGGYSQVSMMIDGKAMTIAVHRLVALKWLPNPNGYTQVNHKYGKRDNRASSLEWVTPSQNLRHRGGASDYLDTPETSRTAKRREYMRRYNANRCKLKD